MPQVQVRLKQRQYDWFMEKLANGTTANALLSDLIDKAIAEELKIGEKE